MSMQNVESWITRVLLLFVGIVGFFLRDGLSQSRAQDEKRDERIEVLDQRVRMLENIAIEIRTSSRNTDQQLKDIKSSIDKIENKLDKRSWH